MENENISEPQSPIGSIFGVIKYYKMGDLDTFIDTLNQEQALYCVIQAAQAAYERNAFNLVESEVLSKAIRKLSTPK
jgi:hypothetical protein